MKTPPHYDDYAVADSADYDLGPEPEPIRLWAETWIELPNWEGVEVTAFSETTSILTWRDPYRGWQHAAVSNVDLAGALWP